MYLKNFNKLDLFNFIIRYYFIYYVIFITFLYIYTITYNLFNLKKKLSVIFKIFVPYCCCHYCCLMVCFDPECSLRFQTTECSYPVTH